ncbi:hypothetical protein ACPA0F_09130 [Solibacillus silvestris]
MINYYIEKGDEDINEPMTKSSTRNIASNPNARIRVNDKTATNGWF